MIKVLVTGGTGFIGSRLVSLLNSTGDYQVQVLARRQEVRLPSGVICHVGDLLDPHPLETILSGIRIVFHLASVKRDITRMRSVNVEGTRRLLEASRAAGVKAFVYVSSAAVIGNAGQTIISEDTPCHPEPEYGRTKYKAEKLVLGYAHDMRVVALRPTDVFGDGDPEQHLRTLWHTIKTRRFIYLGRRDACQNYVYVEDCAFACMRLGQLLWDGQLPGGRVYFLSDPCPLHDMVDTIADLLNVPRPNLVLPQWIGWPLAFLSEGLSRLLGVRIPFSISRMKAMSNSVLYDSSKVRQVLGQEAFIGWREGLGRTIEWYESQ